MMVLSLASVCYNAMRVTGVTGVARWMTSAGVVLCYHDVVSSSDDVVANPLALHMPLDTFEHQMRWLRAHYAVIPLEEFVARFMRGRSLRGTAALTFDDAYVGVFEFAWPLLLDLDMAATVFVIADAPGRREGFWWDHPDVLRAYTPVRQQEWLTRLQGDQQRILGSVAPATVPHAHNRRRSATWDTIARIARSGKGLSIGVHSATHRSLPTLDDVALDHEVTTSRDTIQQRTGVTPLFFAYPYGLWNERVRDAVRSAGYRAAFTLAPDHRTKRDDHWTIPRLNIPASIGDAAFEAWTAGISFNSRGRL